MLPEDSAYALKETQERERRLKWLRFPHIEPLMRYVSVIQEERGSAYRIPNFDPCDGGINAKALFLLEAPGPKAIETGFVSRNNPDQTAKNLLDLMKDTAIPRTSTLFWNVIPWYIGKEDVSHIRPAEKADIQAALPYLRILIGMLSNLKVVVLCGRKPQAVADEIRTFSNALIVQTHHTSPQSFNTSPERKEEAREAFLHVAQIVKQL